MSIDEQLTDPSIYFALRHQAMLSEASLALKFVYSDRMMTHTAATGLLDTTVLLEAAMSDQADLESEQIGASSLRRTARTALEIEDDDELDAVLNDAHDTIFTILAGHKVDDHDFNRADEVIMLIRRQLHCEAKGQLKRPYRGLPNLRSL
jgi:hypothetical protein